MDGKDMDERFKQVFSDPRFRTLRKKDKTLKIDNRFKSMFTEDKFKLKYSMDKRGKSKKHLISEDYKKFYRISDDEDENKELGDKSEQKPHLDQNVAESSDEDVNDQNGRNCSDNSTIKNVEDKKELNLTHKFGYHRGFQLKSDDEDDASSSSSSESEESEAEEDELEHDWGELDKDAQEIDESTSRIAICNADWDRINAQDLYVLLNSFKSAAGTIRYVRIYYSKFGKERLKIEEQKGPSEFIFGRGNNVENSIDDDEKCKENIDFDDEISVKNYDDDDNVEDDNDDNVEDDNDDNVEDDNDDNVEDDNDDNVEDDNDDNVENDDDDEITDSKTIERLRRYQLERLKYYYAIAEFDSPQSAEVIYKELDGMEYESSATTLDIRFVPDETTFDDEILKSECLTLPSSDNYDAPNFVNTALQQSKVRLTWDETDHRRKNAFDKAFEEDNEDDLKAYLATTSSEDEYEDESLNNINPNMEESEKINKYKDLLKSIDKSKDEDYEMEVTWEPNLKSATENLIKNKDLPDINDDDENVDQNSENNDSDIDNQTSGDESIGLQKSKPKYKKWKQNKVENNDELKKDSTDLELLMLDIDQGNQNKKHFNYKEIVDNYNKKGRKDKTENDEHKDVFEFNAEDPRFTAIYSSHLYNVDQSNPNFKKTKAFDQILSKRKDKAKLLINDEKSFIPTSATAIPQTKSWKNLVLKVKDQTSDEVSKRKKLEKNPNKNSRFNINKKFKR